MFCVRWFGFVFAKLRDCLGNKKKVKQKSKKKMFLSKTKSQTQTQNIISKVYQQLLQIILPNSNQKYIVIIRNGTFTIL